MIVIGVDPGKSGALALLGGDGRLIAVADMPVAGNIVSAALAANIACTWATYDDRRMAVIEDVHAMPRQGVTSSFSFGRSLGAVEGVLSGSGWPVTYVSPARWKRALGLTADKGTARRRAIELWPTQASMFARVKDDGRAEAALIAHWWLHHGEGRGKCPQADEWRR